MPSISGTFSSAAIVSTAAPLDFAPGTISQVLVLDAAYNEYQSATLPSVVGSTDVVKVYGPSGTVPALATINIIYITVWNYANPGGGSVVDDVLKLVKAGTVQATNYATGTQFHTGAVGQVTYTISGTGWTAVDVNDSGFGVAFSAAIDNSVDGLHSLAYWDAVAYEIDYTAYVAPTASSRIDEHYYDGSTYHRANECFCASEGNKIPNPYAGVPTEATDRDISADPITEYTDPLDEINN